MSAVAHDGWRKSSFSGSNGGQCVEVLFDYGAVHIRDSKHRRGPAAGIIPEPTITVTAEQWAAFIEAVIHETAQPTTPLAIADSEGVALHSAAAVVLRFTFAEWDAFVAGARAGEFAQELRAA